MSPRPAPTTKRSFNPRAREGRDGKYMDRSTWIIEFQSTRPRRARLECKYEWATCYFVSIHAPAKGATVHRRPRAGQDPVSIHAPAKGATMPTPWHHQRGHVSIHAPAKGATPAARMSYFRMLVSIHAPAKGATLSQAGASLYLQGFNPRAREGRDLYPRYEFRSRHWFQSTRPRRARLLE